MNVDATPRKALGELADMPSEAALDERGVLPREDQDPVRQEA
jgi:hypothetical protein